MMWACKGEGDLVTDADPILHLRTSPGNLRFDIYFSEMADRAQAMNNYGIFGETGNAVLASSVICIFAQVHGIKIHQKVQILLDHKVSPLPN